MKGHVRPLRPARKLAASALVIVLTLLSPPALTGQQAAGPGDWTGRVVTLPEPEIVVGGPGSANYRLAARFAPYKLDELLHSTSVEPRWIEGSERFWYEFETSQGRSYMIVDPERGTRRAIFDNDVLAAELTRITRDPYDAQHLPIRSIRFIDARTLEFEVESSQDEEQEDDSVLGERVDTLQRQEERPPRRGEPDKKVHHFRYDVDTQILTRSTSLAASSSTALPASASVLISYAMPA
jgi:hypothetical protein